MTFSAVMAIWQETSLAPYLQWAVLFHIHDHHSIATEDYLLLQYQVLELHPVLRLQVAAILALFRSAIQ